MTNDLELILNIAKLQKSHEEAIQYIRKLEDALFKLMDYQALGLARCLEAEMVKAQAALQKTAVFNAQLNQLLKTKYE